MKRSDGVRSGSPRPPSVTRRGMTLMEILITLLVMSVLLIPASLLVSSAWQSYQDLWWQNAGNLEARRGLDAACDYIRMSGSQLDAMAFGPSYEQVSNPSRADQMGVNRFQDGTHWVMAASFPKQKNMLWLHNGSAQSV